jgi:hypothetical protein
MQKQTRDLLLMLFIGVFIGISAVMVWSTERGGTGDAVSTPSGAENEAPVPSASSTASISSSSALFPIPPSIPDNTRVGLSVIDQPQGDSVAVSGLTIVGTKWIAIYDNREGKPGWILGAARVHEGDVNATVDLLRSNVVGGTYYAAILNDDGDSVFNRLTDLPPLSPDKVTVVRFWVK